MMDDAAFVETLSEILLSSERKGAVVSSTVELVGRRVSAIVVGDGKGGSGGESSRRGGRFTSRVRSEVPCLAHR